MPSIALHMIKCHKLYGQDAELSPFIKAVTFYDGVLSKTMFRCTFSFPECNEAIMLP